MSAQSAIFNPSQTTSAASGDGFSVPRLTTTGRLAIAFTAADKGMMVYDTTLNSLFIWNGTAWELIDGTGTSSNTQVLFNDNGATAGDPTMTFDKTTDTLSIQNLVVSGTVTALGGTNASATRAAASDYAAVTFDGTTTSTRITSTLTGQNIGTGDFSVWCRFRVPASVGASNRGLISLTSNATSTAQPESVHLFMASNAGELALRIYGATSSDIRQATVNGFLAAYTGQVVDAVITRTGATLKVYINGVDTAYVESTGGTPPAWSATVTSGFCNVGYGIGVQVFTGSIYRSVVFNRALSASDVTDLITQGVNPADQWGTQTAAYTSDFSAGVDGWSALGGANTTLTGNIDGIDGQDNNLRSVNNATANTITGAFRGTFARSKRYRLTYSYYLPSTNTTLKGIRTTWWNNGNAGLGPLGTTTDSWTTVTEESPIDTTAVGSNSNLGIHGTTVSGAVSFLGTAGDLFYVRAISWNRIGAIVDLNFTIGTGYQATDRSTNQLNGTLFNGVSWTMPETSARLYATTAFAGNSQMLGTLAIPTNAIIEDIIVYTTGVSTVYVGNASGNNSIVAATVIAAGYNRLTLSAFRSSTGNLWVNCTQPDTLQFTIVYSIAQP